MRRPSVRVRPVAPRAEIISAFYFFFTTLPNGSVGRSCERIQQLQNLRKHGVFAGFFFFRNEVQNSICNKKSHSNRLSEIFSICLLIKFTVSNNLRTELPLYYFYTSFNANSPKEISISFKLRT